MHKFTVHFKMRQIVNGVLQWGIMASSSNPPLQLLGNLGLSPLAAELKSSLTQEIRDGLLEGPHIDFTSALMAGSSHV